MESLSTDEKTPLEGIRVNPLAIPYEVIDRHFTVLHTIQQPFSAQPSAEKLGS
jgi:hypothetical protein